MQAHQCKTPLCSELGQKQDLQPYRNYYYEGIIRLCWNLTHYMYLSAFYSWLLPTFNALACSFQKLLGFKVKQDNQGYKGTNGKQISNTCFRPGRCRRIALSEYTKT